MPGLVEVALTVEDPRRRHNRERTQGVVRALEVAACGRLASHKLGRGAVEVVVGLPPKVAMGMFLSFLRHQVFENDTMARMHARVCAHNCLTLVAEVQGRTAGPTEQYTHRPPRLLPGCYSQATNLIHLVPGGAYAIRNDRDGLVHGLVGTGIEDPCLEINGSVNVKGGGNMRFVPTTEVVIERSRGFVRPAHLVLLHEGTSYVADEPIVA